MKYRLGALLVFISSVGFGTMAIFANLAYQDGVDPISLLVMRFGFAAVVMTGLVLWRREPWPRGRTLLGLILMGAVGYFGQSLCFFTALTMADAGLVALLLYLYPALVALLAAAMGRERLTVSRSGAVVLALVGTGLAIGPRLVAQPLGVVLGVGAALIYSVYILAGNSLLEKSGPLASSTIIMASAACVFLILGAVRGIRAPASPAGWIGVAGVVVFCTILAVTLFLIGLKTIGPTRVSVLSTFEPITTVLLGALFLGESLTIWTAIGAVCIVSATVLLAVVRPPRLRQGT